MEEKNKITYAEINKKRLNDIERNTPEEMKALPNWCVHRSFYNKTDGSRKKVIINCNTGKWGASVIDSATWTTFDNALAYARNNNYEGLTFVLNKSGILAIDIDKCVTDGKRSQLAWDLLNRTGLSYAERSMSGKGIHIFVKGSLGNSKNKNDAIGLEAYDTAKFMSLTGNMINDRTKLESSSPALMQYLGEKLGEKTAVRSYAKPITSTASDDDVLAQIRHSAKKGELFEKLYSGVDVMGNHSVSDMLLLNILAFFTKCDSNQTERLFRSSGLYRPEKGDNYISRSVNKAIETLHTTPKKLNTVKANFNQA